MNGKHSQKQISSQKEERRLVAASQALSAADRHAHRNQTGSHRVLEQLVAEVKDKSVAHSRALVGGMSKMLGGNRGASALGPWVKSVLKPSTNSTDLVAMPYGNLSGGSYVARGSTTFDVTQPANEPGWFSFSPTYASDTIAGWYTNASNTNGAVNNNGLSGTQSITLANLPFTESQLTTPPLVGAQKPNIKCKFNHAKVTIENISADINRAGWGFVGQVVGGGDSIGVSTASYETLSAAGLCADVDVLEPGSKATWHVMSPFEQDYQFATAEIPWPQLSYAEYHDPGTTLMSIQQVYPVFGFFPPSPTE